MADSRPKPTLHKALPADFLRTFNSITNFTVVINKVKFGSTADVNVEFNRDECLALLWAFQLLAERNSGRPVAPHAKP